MADRVIQRHDTAARWQSINPVLATGEIGIEIDGAKGYKIGDGKTRWNDLPYPANPTNVVQELGNNENAVPSQKLVTEKLSELGSEVVMYSISEKLFSTEESVNSIIKEVYVKVPPTNFEQTVVTIWVANLVSNGTYANAIRIGNTASGYNYVQVLRENFNTESEAVDAARKIKGLVGNEIDGYALVDFTGVTNPLNIQKKCVFYDVTDSFNSPKILNILQFNQIEDALKEKLENEDLGKVEILISGKDKYIDLNGSVGSVVDVMNPVESSGGYNYSILEVDEGDIVKITGIGGGRPRLWAFLDSEHKIIEVAKVDMSEIDEFHVCPIGSSLCVINSKTFDTCYFSKKGTIYNQTVVDNLSLKFGLDVELNELHSKMKAIAFMEQSSEWVRLVKDKEGRILFGIRRDGSVYHSEIGQENNSNNKSEEDEPIQEIHYMSSNLDDIASFLSVGQYGVYVAGTNTTKLVRKTDSGIDDVIVGQNLVGKTYLYCGNKVGFNETGRFGTLIEPSNNSDSVVIDENLTFNDFSDEVWDFSKNEDGNYTISEQCDKYMNELCLNYPNFIKKYDVMAGADYLSDDGLTIYADNLGMKSYMKGFGFDNYPEYMNGTVNGQQCTIVGYESLTYKITPSYRPYYYIVSSPFPSSSGIKKRKIYLQAGCQGQEYGSSIALCNFVKNLITNVADINIVNLMSKFDFYVVPVLEAYGAYHYTYNNALKVNVNRNYPNNTWTQTEIPFGDRNSSGINSGDQFETRMACGMLEKIKPSIAADIHSGALTETNFFITVLRTCYNQTVSALHNACTSLMNGVIKFLPEYFGTKFDFPPVECQNYLPDEGNARSYFFNINIPCSALIELKSGMNWVNDGNGNRVDIVREDTIGSADALKLAEGTLRAVVEHLCKYNIQNF